MCVYVHKPLFVGIFLSLNLENADVCEALCSETAVQNTFLLSFLSLVFQDAMMKCARVCGYQG